jgi:hypothetical protein
MNHTETKEEQEHPFFFLPLTFNGDVISQRSEKKILVNPNHESQTWTSKITRNEKKKS